MLLLSAWYVTVLSALFVLVSVLMMLIILIQKPKGGGLAGAFGGAGGGSANAAFGAKVGDVLTYATVVFFLLFLVIAMGLTWTINPEQERLKRSRATSPAAATPATPEPQPDAEDVIEAATPVMPEVADEGRAPQGEADAVVPVPDGGTPDEAAPAGDDAPTDTDTPPEGESPATP